MTLAFKKATKEKTKARVAVYGPSGSGKSMGALEIAAVLGKRIAVGDSENRSASLYAGRNGIEFDVCELAPPYTPNQYTDLIKLAEREGYDVLVIDSLSHAWAGEGGALEMADQAKRKGGNGFTAWADITPMQNKLIAAIQHCKIHLVVTMRSKTEYIIEERESRGRTVQAPKRIGLAPIQRKELEYEFTVFAEFDMHHNLTVDKTRVSTIDLKMYSASELKQFAEAIRDFHDSGAQPIAAEAQPPAPPSPAEKPRAQPAQTSPAPKANATNYATYWRLFKNSSNIGKQLSDVPTDSLTSYISRLEKAVEHPDYHDDATQYLVEAKSEYARRLEQEAAEAALAGEVIDPETGEVRGAPLDAFRDEAASVDQQH